MSGSATMLPRVTVIVPCRNEERYIAACLDSIIATTYPLDQLDVLVVDGRSSDRTRDIIATYAARYPWIRLLDNPRRIVSTAMNIAIAQATGDIVVRMDAHVVYPAAYLTRLVTALDETGADNVGARLVTVPAGPGPLARAIAIALSHPLGVGNSHHRLAGTVRRWVDTVPFGCYRRDVFGRLGGFDEDLVRNQDDEFNARLIRQGGRVLLLPDLTARYYARPGLRQLWRMYYQYGLFKPLVARKVRRLTTWRQLVPAAFVAGLAAAALASLVRPAALPFLVLPALAYAAVVMVTALGHARAEGLRCALGLMLAFPTLHVSYGVGFLRGLWRAVITPKAVIDPAAIPLSR